MNVSLLQLTNLSHSWEKKSPLFHIASFSLQLGESVFLYGPSGSGKSTLLNIITGIQKPTTGDVIINGVMLSALNNSKLDALRGQKLGVITQTLNLLPYLTINENLELMCQFSGKKVDTVWRDYLLEHLNIKDIAQQKANTLSIGQQQRAAIARALIHRPALIIADEPTSALDDDNAKAFIELLLKECSAHAIGILLVSHDLRFQHLFNRSVKLSDLSGDHS